PAAAVLDADGDRILPNLSQAWVPGNDSRRRIDSHAGRRGYETVSQSVVVRIDGTHRVGVLLRGSELDAGLHVEGRAGGMLLVEEQIKRVGLVDCQPERIQVY